MFNSHTLRLPGLFQSPMNFTSQRDGAASQRSKGTLGPSSSIPDKSYDVEDGELSDTPPAGRQTWPAAPGTLDGINNLHTSRDAKSTTNPAQSATGPQSKQAASTSSAAAKQGFTDVYLAEQNMIAKKFVLAWSRSGKTYDQLLAEGLNAQILTGIFNELGISLKSGVSDAQPIVQQNPSSQISPISAAQAKIPKKNAAAPRPVISTSLGPSDTSSTPQSTRSTMPNGHPTLPKKPPPPSVATGHKRVASPAATSPAATAPVTSGREPNSIPDRQEYIAKLMAAKNKKPELPKTATPFTTHSTVSFGSLSSVLGTESNQPQSSSAAELAEAKKRSQTAFVKKKMEELAQKKATKAAEAAAAASSASSHQQSLLLSRPQYDGNNEISDYSTDKASVTRTFAPQATTNSTNADITSMTSSVATPIIASASRPTTRNPSVGGRIPGLFMTAPPPAPTPARDVTTSESAAPKDSALGPTPTRKRPVAADFMDETWQAAKRPSRQSPGKLEEHVAIEVSDDDMEPTDVKTRSEHGSLNALPTKDLPVRQSTESHDDRAIAMKRPLLAAPVPSSESIRRQMEILTMKRKIAELELRKRTRQVSTRPATPSKSVVVRANVPKEPQLGHKTLDTQTQIAEAPSPDAAVQGAGVSEDLSGPSIPDTLVMPSTTNSQPPNGDTLSSIVSDAARAASPDLSQATAAALAASTQQPALESAISLPTAAPIDAPDQKIRRRAEIKSGLPALEASYANNNSKLEALKAQMRQLEEAIRQDQEDKQRLIDELESLGVDTEGMDHNELRETKEEIMAQAVADADAGVAMQTDDDVKSIRSPPREGDILTAEDITEPDPLPRIPSQGLSTQSTAASMSISSAARTMSESASDSNENDEAMHDQMASESEEGSGSRREEHSEEENAVEANGRGSEITSHSSSGQSDEDKVAVEQESLDDELVLRASGSEDLSMDEDSEGESGEISSSDSASQVTDDKSYSPEIIDIEDGDNGHVKDTDQAEVSEAESDDVYEPPEPDQSHMREAATDAATADTSSDAAEEDYEPPDALTSRHSEEGEVAEDEEEYTPPEIQPIRSAPPASPAAASQSRSEGEISEHEPSEVSEMADVADSEPMVNAFHDLPSTERFQPYQSALRNFRAYRFHPEFASTVPGGWRSATYSFQGDPEKTWCPEELNGGKCDDAYCDHQHLRSMTVQDDELLRQLGVSNPGSDDTEKAEFLAGLRSMIMDLRQSDPTADALAKAIISFRRKYMEERGKDTIFTS